MVDALLRGHSTVKAGARLGLSQSAVSAALRRLRAALSDNLFFRRCQRLEPTQNALSLKALLRKALGRVEILIQGPAALDPLTSRADFRISAGVSLPSC